MPDGSDSDGEELLTLVGSSDNAFPWDVNLLIREIEENLDAQVVDILRVDKGSNNYAHSNATPMLALMFGDL